ncbi:flavin reductase family protein [Mucilaginibacter glaciei]|uniref:Flavin reductase family protein n=1 Tax=Mucilaginibacter glaciei TaxID=2772109 RepID=A0A926S224_9SPHI|nr:flavin reductase family protein [Mucilaginibacter glaciei]MBD1393417.1 flavin reductase family protein [Mucilaginibacter glaciei]
MIEINPSDISVEARYKLLTGSITPRPIGVISTISANGITNFAPFSYFNIAGHAPMAVSFAVAGPKPDGTEKDTLRNAKLPDDGGTGEFVAHIATESFATAMAKSAFPLTEDQSEFYFTGLTAVTAKMIRAPRIKEAPIAFECKTIQVVTIGRSRLIIGEILYMHFAEQILQDNYRVDYQALKAIGRMAGSRYCKTTDVFEIKDEKFFPGNN